MKHCIKLISTKGYRKALRCLCKITFGYRALVFFCSVLSSENFRNRLKRQTSDTSSDIEWQPVVQQVTTNDNECTIQLILLLYHYAPSFYTTTNSLNLEEDFEEGLLNKSRNKPLGRNINSKKQELR